MKRRLLNLLTALSLLLPLSSVGCHTAARTSVPRPSGSDAGPSPPEQRSAANGNQDVPVIYAGHLKSDPITDEQRARVLAAAREFDHGSHDVWFILVLSSRGGEDGYLSAQTYFMPDEVGDRVRRGRFALYNSRFENAGAARGVRRPKPQSYVHVVEEGQNVDDRAGPKIPLLPFAAPENVSDADLIKLVDLARSRPRIDNGDDHYTPDPSLPILRIGVNGDEADVMLGWQVGPLAGGGEILHCRRERNLWKAVSLSQWLS